MHIIDIIWLPQVIDKLDWKHNVTPEEVEEVLFDNPLYRKVQKDISRARIFMWLWAKLKLEDI